jgi:pimeloyl-ACP methyl ester carboxylesterase
MPIAMIDGLRLYYEQAGQGFPVLLIHAFPTDHALWTLQVPVFSEHYKVISLDLRGLGKSGKPNEGYKPRDFTKDVKGLLDQLGIKRVFTVGISLGGAVALQLTLDYPEITQGTIWIGSFGDMRREVALKINGKKVKRPLLDAYIQGLSKGYPHFWRTIWKPNMGTLFHERFADSHFGQSFIRYMFEERYVRLNNNPRPLMSILQEVSDSFWDKKILDKLGSVKVPVAIMAGKNDGTAPYGKIVHKLVADSEFHIFKDSGHFCNIDQFYSFNTIALKFLHKNSPIGNSS